MQVNPKAFSTSQKPEGVLPSSNYTLVLATHVKNQTAYLAEWIQHHQLVGVDRILIYNDNRERTIESDRMRAIADPWIKEGFVEWIDWPTHALELGQPPYGPRYWTHGQRGEERFNITLYGECLTKSDGLEWHKHSTCQRAAFIDAIGEGFISENNFSCLLT